MPALLGRGSPPVRRPGITAALPTAAAGGGRREGEDGASLVEPLAVWALFGLVAFAVALTYSRLAPRELYGVSEGGAAGGFGRMLVFLNFPTALVALALLPFAADRLGIRAARLLAALAAVLCLVTVAPGVVDQADLDAKAINLVPALGVAVVLALTLAALVRRGTPGRLGRLPGDPLRVVLAVALALAAVPWVAAELGFYASEAPAVGRVFLADETVPEPGNPEIRAVHLGHHHGLDGALFALAALVLSRELGRLGSRRLRLALAAYLSLMLVYGLANALQDFWLEQVYKRGASSFRFPGMLRPELSPAWLGILLASAAVYVLAGRPIALRRLRL